MEILSQDVIEWMKNDDKKYSKRFLSNNNNDASKNR